MQAFLEDEPDYYYEGRFAVDAWNSNKDWSMITISYDVDPFKTQKESTLENDYQSYYFKNIKVAQYGIYLVGEEQWLWDPFNFDTGKINFSGQYRYDWSDAKYIVFYPDQVGQIPVVPTIHVKSVDGNGITMRLINSELGIDVFKKLNTGIHTDSDFIFSGMHSSNQNKVYLMGNGTISFEFHPGRL